MFFEKEGKRLSQEEFEEISGARWLQRMEFGENFEKIRKEGSRLHKKGKMTPEQLWLGKYYQKELSSGEEPDVTIRWIDPLLGWGVFANRAFRKMEFIAEYVGKLRKRERRDTKNGYCFEYVLVQGIKSPYTIDALDQGGVSRYINHSAKPNLNSSLATLEHTSHVILYAKEPVAKGEQLCYDYGPDYWAKRAAPLPL